MHTGPAFVRAKLVTHASTCEDLHHDYDGGRSSSADRSATAWALE